VGVTSHNRTVYASPPVGGSGYVLARSIASLIPTPKLRHIFAALGFASQSPYSGCKNVVNSRNVMRNWAKIGWKNIDKIKFYGYYKLWILLLKNYQ
jgi:hypothetical protein